MAPDRSSDTLIGIAGICSAITGVISLTSAPRPVKWWLFPPIIAACALFIGALVVFDRTMVRTGRIGDNAAIAIFLTAILAGIGLLAVITLT